MINLSHAPVDENRTTAQNQGVIRKLSFNSQNHEAAIQEYLDSVQTQKPTHSQKRLGRQLSNQSGGFAGQSNSGRNQSSCRKIRHESITERLSREILQQSSESQFQPVKYGAPPPDRALHAAGIHDQVSCPKMIQSTSMDLNAHLLMSSQELRPRDRGKYQS